MKHLDNLKEFKTDREKWKYIINLSVYPQDLKGRYTWNEAMEVCDELGNGWRLPTRVELPLHVGKQRYHWWS